MSEPDLNRRLDELKPYPFERLGQLLADTTPQAGLDPLRLSLGEPRHPAPDFLIDALADRALLTESLGRYPATRGQPALREAMASWLSRRFDCAVDPESQVLPVAGTREALFGVAQALLPQQSGSAEQTLTRLPNPFYQIYEGAALLAGSSIAFYEGETLNSTPGQLGALQAADWGATDLLYLCSPGNPSGNVWSESDLVRLIELANEHNFLVIADECYSEIYQTEQAAPAGLLSAAKRAGYPAFDRCLVFNSLSKRSNLPGLRSGLVAGDARLLSAFLKYRTYQGCALPVHTQQISTLAWNDDEHVLANRARYQSKLVAASAALSPLAGPLGWEPPAGGFFFWLPAEGLGFEDDETLTRVLLEEQNIEVLPGRYLARADATGHNPGIGRIRVAWVADEAACAAATDRLLRFAADHGAAR